MNRTENVPFDSDFLSRPENEVIKDNIGFIQRCAKNFITEIGLLPKDYDDVFQEAAIAYLIWFRKLRDGLLPENGRNFASSSIYYHLMGKFVDRDGVGVTFRRLRQSGAPSVIYVEDPGDTVFSEDSDSEFGVYYRDWLSHLDRIDREIVVSRIRYGGRRGSHKIRPTTYSRHLSKIKRAYDEYFRNAG